MKKIVRIKESELVNLIDKIITETTRKQKISEGVRKLAVKQVIKEEKDGKFSKFNNQTELEREGYKMSNIEFGDTGFIVTMERKNPYHRIEIRLVNRLDDDDIYKYDENDDEVIAINKQKFISSMKSAPWADDYITKSDVTDYAVRIAYWLSKEWNVPLI